ncbi:hypothetical protein EJF18_70039 [Clavispora lusitaniae]|uniref:DUF4536 domain-containing protein n=3 Tax=Clavispora lusitaniae TaxID=36911 RepID=C4YBH6_CLAL4|nr:uncharacterized protein CLUG_05554 [Clavispora lusitaniae ATCC 42720]KAF7581089.1 hypothetical protein FOB63_003726 [Clavispora lusitaniae]EEQ41426.1 hypothetical protein CLUG_05554 [Clavispora lusitaniae ATCC 42720]OVF06935.1 hypothetical protein A9F13_16g00286 [Clavispora lusitaniae]QFZ29978.1 hypothetical protein EJF14_70039 [Clavispora lusitaniae]QFZ35642.1 hypothetical protein EJF16_70039 [Clavispora lusitaniae]
MSNILGAFNPPPARDLSSEDCMACTAIQSMVCFGGGGYFLSPMPFRNKSGLVDLKKHPVWFQRSVRGIGIGLIALGMFRLGEVGQIWYRRRSG